MWLAQMEPQVKSAASPERACSQEKTTAPEDESEMYAMAPQARMKMVENSGRPARST